MWFMLQGTRKLSLGRCCGAGITVRKLIPILRKGNQGSVEAVCPALHQGEQGQFPQVLQALCCSEKQPDIRDADGPTSPRRSHQPAAGHGAPGAGAEASTSCRAQAAEWA